jgi:hypothetical protein
VFGTGIFILDGEKSLKKNFFRFNDFEEFTNWIKKKEKSVREGMFLLVNDCG